MADFPKWQYHPTKGEFICPSEDFLKTLDNWQEYEDLPFTGDRKIESKASKCFSCTLLLGKNKKLKLDVVDLKLEIEELKSTISALKHQDNQDK